MKHMQTNAMKRFAHSPWTPSPRSRHNGSVLIISLLILVVLTLIGITAMSTSGLEERMAGNVRDEQVAFQASEIALRDAEAFIEGIASTAGFNGTNGLYPQGSSLDISPDSAIWTGNNSAVYGGALGDEKTPPRYVIEVLDTQGNNDVNIGGYGDSSGVGAVADFRITARGTGISNSSTVILQSYYGKRL
jgi:type IV pilus assembly protein PilX